MAQASEGTYLLARVLAIRVLLVSTGALPHRALQNARTWHVHSACQASCKGDGVQVAIAGVGPGQGGQRPPASWSQADADLAASGTSFRHRKAKPCQERNPYAGC